MTQQNSPPGTAPSDETPTQQSATQNAKGPNRALDKLTDPEENTHRATQDSAETSTTAEPSELQEDPPQKHITEAVRRPSAIAQTKQPEEQEEQPKELPNVLNLLKAVHATEPAESQKDPPQEPEEGEEQPKELPNVGDLIMVMNEEDLPLIFSGQKTMEVRGRRVRLGPTWVAVEGYIYGQIMLVKAPQITRQEFEDMRDQHRWPLDAPPPRSKNLFGISFIQPKKFTDPIPFYRQPRRNPWALFRRHENDLPRPSWRTGNKAATLQIESVKVPMTPYEPPPTPQIQSRRKRKNPEKLERCKGESKKN